MIWAHTAQDAAFIKTLLQPAWTRTAVLGSYINRWLCNGLGTTIKKPQPPILPRPFRSRTKCCCSDAFLPI